MWTDGPHLTVSEGGVAEDYCSVGFDIEGRGDRRFLHRVAQTKISVQKHIDQGTASFGKKRSLMQRVLNKRPPDSVSTTR